MGAILFGNITYVTAVVKYRYRVDTLLFSFKLITIGDIDNADKQFQDIVDAWQVPL